jgi:hypothetical protein
MSLAEKMAVLYLLGKMLDSDRQAAIEVGSYKGGSLRALSRYFKKVYSLDIDHSAIVDKEQYNNVEWIEGDSKETLPRLIQEINASGEDVGLILIDGDHSYDAAVQDINNALAYVPRGEAFLLVHDSWYHGVRDAINKANWNECPYVQLVEKDFVAGDLVYSDEEGKIFVGGLAMAALSPQKRQGDLVIGQTHDFMYRETVQLLIGEGDARR